MLVVGLGNPGIKYSQTKHNFGFWVLDKIIERRSLKWQSGYGDYVYTKDKFKEFTLPGLLPDRTLDNIMAKRLKIKKSD